MSVTPHRDAAAATIAEARRRQNARGSGDPRWAVANRLDVDVTEALMLGYGDLKDLGTCAGQTGDIVIRVLASALSSYLLTACSGSTDVANFLLDGALRELRQRTLKRIANAAVEGIAATVDPSEPRGRA